MGNSKRQPTINTLLDGVDQNSLGSHTIGYTHDQWQQECGIVLGFKEGLISDQVPHPLHVPEKYIHFVTR